MMKYILFSTLLSVLIACAPEKTMNRKINGTWELVTINGKTLPDTFSETVTFTPEGRNGKIEYHVKNNHDSTGTYTIMKYEYLTTSFKDNSKLGYEETVYIFTKCTSSELILTQQKAPSNVYYFKKI